MGDEVGELMKEKVFDGEFFKMIQNLSLNMNISLSQGGVGGRKSKAKGTSVEFSDFREYVPGDDIRRIDWGAYGRFDKLFVKLFMEEREAVINIFLDCSSSMATDNMKKALTALKVAGAFSYISLGNQDRVCINKVLNGYLEESQSYASKGMIPSALDTLQKFEFTGKESLASAIKRKDFKRKGVAVIISDFMLKDGIEDALKYLMYKNQKVIVIHVLAEEEISPKLSGDIKLLDSETGETLLVTITPRIKKSYEENLNKFVNNIKEKVARVGGTYVMVNGDESIEKTIFNIFAKEGRL